MRKKISFIIPIYNEERNIAPLNTALEQTIAGLRSSYAFEFIFVNDGSRDASDAQLQEIARTNPEKKIITFTRNFGHQNALSAGYDHAQGDAIITIDADMQHPPELVVAMLREWEKGFSIVYARKIERKEGRVKALISQAYYSILDRITEIPMPRNVSDFRLIDKTVLQELQRFRDHCPYFRGLVPWTGFPHTYLDFKCNERLSGTSAYTWRKMFKLSFDGITGFSTFPLRLAAYIGFIVVGTGIAMFSVITIDFFLFGAHYPLFKWLITIIYIFLGVQFILTWFLGEYIGRIYDQQRNRPLYVVRATTNLKPQPRDVPHENWPDHNSTPVKNRRQDMES